MRTFTLSAVVALLLAGSSVAMAQTSQAQSQTGPQKGSAIRSILVVDIEELKPDVRSKVDAIVASTKNDDIKSIRASIQAMPQAVSALNAKGRNPAQVVAINIDQNGVLTMFTKAA